MNAYYRWRHLVYVEERGWEDLRRADGLERDQFDTDNTVHLLALDGSEFVGASRMLPMSEPTLLSEIFPNLVEREPVPRDAETIEWTRMFVVPARRTGQGPRSVAGALFCGVMEYCLSVGARRVGGVMETFWLPRWQRFGWTAKPMGLPRDIGGSMTLAAFVDVDQRALEGVRAATGWTESVLTWSKETHDGRRQAFGTEPFRKAG
nr:acyl-homoserine-lactone synthase [Microvirga terricola]